MGLGMTRLMVKVMIMMMMLSKEADENCCNFEYDLPAQCLLIDMMQMMNNLYISRPSWRMGKPILRGRIEMGKR